MNLIFFGYVFVGGLHWKISRFNLSVSHGNIIIRFCTTFCLSHCSNWLCLLYRSISMLILVSIYSLILGTQSVSLILILACRSASILILWVPILLMIGGNGPGGKGLWS